MNRFALARLGALCIALAIGSSAYAFKPNSTGHGSITMSAFEDISVDVEGETLSFSKRAREEIRAANFEVDNNQLNSALHFDDENLDGGSSYLIPTKEAVILRSIAGDGKGARELLGGALHSIQDFYSHSNAVDQGFADPAFGSVTLSRLPLSTPTCVGGNQLIPGIGLTSGYFNLISGNCSYPTGKCTHGLVCSGIAKDTASHPLFGTAFGRAINATTAYIYSILDDPRMKADPRATKRLLDVRPMLGAVIDDTGSMSGVISGVRSAVIGIVNAVQGTEDEPDKYLLETFNDPTVGTPGIYTEASAFISALGGVFANGGGDCPELSMAGTFLAVDAASPDSRLFIYTDASAKDASLVGAVANLAAKKRITLNTALSGNCSPYDPVYFELARKTGGQVLIMTRNEPGSTLANMMAPLVKNDVHLLLQASLEMTGAPVSYAVPIDETITQASFSVGMVTKGVITLKRPDGSAVVAGQPGVVITDVIGGKIFTVDAPAVGNWSVEIQGTGTTLITASGSTPLYPHKFDFVNLQGRPGHEGLFPIAGAPVAGKTQKVRALVFGAYASINFSFRSPVGALISNMSLVGNDPDAATDEDLVGTVTPPSEPFLVYVTGNTPAGNPFQRVVPGQVTASTVQVSVPTNALITPAGRATPLPFTVTNYGPAMTFSVKTVDSKNFLSTGAPASITLAMNESKTITLATTPPLSTPEFTPYSIGLSVNGGNDTNSNAASVSLTVGSSNTAPVCSAAVANPKTITSNNRQMVAVTIQGVTDADGEIPVITITGIKQDEWVGSAPDASGVGQPIAMVKAERAEEKNGRVYHIAFSASDNKGGACASEVTVEVRRYTNKAAVDDGPKYDSTVPSPKGGDDDDDEDDGDD
ncbi:MAG TPA: hypothetical protein VJM53_04255 [Burkholderiales bacterium]|nr:hypothetical protein [Burkholderiales bacterium]